MGIRQIAALVLDSLRSPAPVAAVPVVDAADAQQAHVDAVLNSVSGQGINIGSLSIPGSGKTLSDSDIKKLVSGSAYAAKIVNKLPEEAMRKGWRVLDSDGSEIKPDDAVKALKIKEQFRKADKLARKYGGAWILLVTEDAAGRLEDPLAATDSTELLNLVVLGHNSVSVRKRGDDIRLPGYGEPEIVEITSSSTLVHASRMLYFDGADVDDDTRAMKWIGESVLQSCWPAIRGRETFDDAAEQISRTATLGIMTIGNQLDLRGFANAGQAIKSKIEKFAQGRAVWNVGVLGKGDEYKTVSHTAAGMKDLDAATMTTLVIASGMPEQLFRGNSPGGLNADGESHEKLWSKTVADHQDELKPLLERVYSAMGLSDFTIEFNPLDELTEKGAADLAEQKAKTAEILMRWDVVKPEEVRSVLLSGGSVTDISAETTEPEPKNELPEMSPEELEAEEDYRSDLANK